MQIEQALYGDERGGHSLLASSGDPETSNGIIHRLDLPDSVPAGIEWSPFVRGFPYGNRYVLSRTFHDPNASRNGMVFSHAILAHLDDIVETPNLRPLLSLLTTSDRQRPTPTTVEVDHAPILGGRTEDLVETAETLVAAVKLPVVRLGRTGFEELIVALWTNLSPEIRQGFAFRLSLDPRDLVETPIPAMVCTPQAMAARWSNYPVVRSAPRRESVSLAGAVLSAESKAAAFLKFMQQLGVRPASFSDLRLLERAYHLDVGDATLGRRVGSMRLIEKLSPKLNAGKDAKDTRVRQLCDLLEGTEAEDVRLLRNIRFTAFPLPERIWRALGNWVAENDFSQDQDVALLSILEDATSGAAAVSEWRAAVLAGLKEAARSPQSSFPRAFWRWLRIRSDVVMSIFKYVPAEVEVEQRLVSTTPLTLDKAVAEGVATDALSRGWLRLHGAVLSASCSTLDAVRQQVAVDTDPTFFDGLRLALRRANPPEVVECALEIEDPRIPLVAAETVAEHPKVLEGVEITVTRAQTIWREALAIDPESWKGPANPPAAFHSILDRLLDGDETDSVLIERLSSTPVADLGTYQRRSEIWSRLGGVARQNLLAATASGWIRESTGAGVPFMPDDDLETAILEGGELGHTLDALIPDHVGTAIRMVASLDGYNEQQFLRVMKTVMSRTAVLAPANAETIGRTVMAHRWEDAAALLVLQFKSGRTDVRLSLRECYDLLGFWDRIALALRPISEQEKWQGFHGLAVEIYPSGPDENGLWERAGGDDADLSTKEDGRTRWRKALRNIRNGRGPTLPALLIEMKKDFPNNERISRLVKNRAFRGGVADDLRDE